MCLLQLVQNAVNVCVSLSAIQLPVFSPDGKRTVQYMTQDFTVITNKKKQNV